MTWRDPIPSDEGNEMLIQCDALLDADWRPDGIALGVVNRLHDYGATCATWCGYHDEYHTHEITGAFSVHDLPAINGE